VAANRLADFFYSIGGGAANVILLAPVWLQIVHLLLANLVWLLLVICLAEAGSPQVVPDSAATLVEAGAA
jgi:heme A synthase